MAARTPSQTIGPFFHLGLRWMDYGRVSFAQEGRRVAISGRVFDGAGQPVGDALVETWQRLPEGSAATGEERVHGFGRVETAADGSFRVETCVPDGPAPFLDVTFFARGIMKPLRTRVYLATREAAAREPDLAPLAASPRLETLIAVPVGGSEYRWDVRLQGQGETVFFLP